MREVFALDAMRIGGETTIGCKAFDTFAVADRFATPAFNPSGATCFQLPAYLSSAYERRVQNMTHKALYLQIGGRICCLLMPATNLPQSSLYWEKS
jgi:hypothetical protein